MFYLSLLVDCFLNNNMHLLLIFVEILQSNILKVFLFVILTLYLLRTVFIKMF